MQVFLHAGQLSYMWIDQWAKMPARESSRRGWAHTEVLFDSHGHLLTGDSGQPEVLVFDRDGTLLRSFGVPVTELHGMMLMVDRGEETLWIADTGRKRRPKGNYETFQSPEGGQVIAVDLRGHVMTRLPKPRLPIYADQSFAPTAIAVDLARGEVWVADGYGQSLVHKYDSSGRYIDSLSGAEKTETGRFSCPHSLHVDLRKPENELYVADRGNRRIQVFDLSGNFKRSFGSEFMTGPTDLVVDGERLLVAEFNSGRITLLNANDELIGYLGEDKSACARDGWPNRKLKDGSFVRNGHLEPGKFSSPHSVAVDRDGNLFVTEWLIGGRVTKLART